MHLNSELRPATAGRFPLSWSQSEEAERVVCRGTFRLQHFGLESTSHLVGELSQQTLTHPHSISKNFPQVSWFWAAGATCPIPQTRL